MSRSSKRSAPQISKIEGPDQREGDPNAEIDTAIKQIVSEAITGTGVIDIYAEAGHREARHQH